MGRFSRSRQKQQRKKARKKRRNTNQRIQHKTTDSHDPRHAKIVAEARKLAAESERNCVQVLPEAVAFMARQDDKHGLIRDLFTTDQWTGISTVADGIYVAATVCGFLHRCMQSEAIDPEREELSPLAQELMDRLEMWTMIVPLQKAPGDESWEGLEIAGGSKIGPFVGFHSLSGEALDLTRPRFQSLCTVSHGEAGLRLIELVDLAALGEKVVTKVFGAYLSLLNPATSVPGSNLGSALQKYSTEALEITIEALLESQGIPFREECLDLRHRFCSAQLKAAYQARHGCSAIEDLKAAQKTVERELILRRLNNLEEPIISRAGPLCGDFHVADWLWWSGFKDDGSPDNTTETSS